jgi:hypothetical protein
VADGAITSYCQALSIERMTTPQSGDCPYYSECKHQSGTRCDFYKAKCRKV